MQDVRLLRNCVRTAAYFIRRPVLALLSMWILRFMGKVPHSPKGNIGIFSGPGVLNPTFQSRDPNSIFRSPEPGSGPIGIAVEFRCNGQTRRLYGHGVGMSLFGLGGPNIPSFPLHFGKICVCVRFSEKVLPPMGWPKNLPKCIRHP